MTKWTFIAGMLLGFALPVSAAVSVSADNSLRDMGPAEIIEVTARKALDVLEARRDELRGNPEALFQAVDEVLLPVFDVQRAGDLVLSRHAREATAEQRRRFAQALYRSLVRQYAENALDFSPDRLVVRPVRGELDPRATRVDSEVRLDDGTRVAITYVLRETDAGWKVFDVVAEGLSFVRSLREQYDAEIRRRGLDDVIVRLERATSAASRGGVGIEEPGAESAAEAAAADAA